MNQKTRTEYSVVNTSVAFIAQAAAILMGFFTRVVFTRMLSEGYVGINGLFTDILNILSLSELGVGTAITYALYAPIANGVTKKQQVIMGMFRTFYRITRLSRTDSRFNSYSVLKCTYEKPAQCRKYHFNLFALSY